MLSGILVPFKPSPFPEDLEEKEAPLIRPRYKPIYSRDFSIQPLYVPDIYGRLHVQHNLHFVRNLPFCIAKVYFSGFNFLLYVYNVLNVL